MSQLLQNSESCAICPLKYCRSAEDLLIYNAMKMSDGVLLTHNIVYNMFIDEGIKNRSFAVEWMNRVMTRESDDTRDMSIRVFDCYLVKSYSENPRILRDTCFISFAAAASIVLGSKLSHSRNPINASWLTAFNTEDILFFEKQILIHVGSKLSPLTTPLYFLHYAVSLCADLVPDTEELVAMATSLIGEFWEDPASLLFAPSTIAISAIIASLSLLKIECQSFLQKLPEFFFPNEEFLLFTKEEGKLPYLNFHPCMAAMEKLPSFRTHNCNNSPTSVMASPAVNEELATTASCSEILFKSHP